MKLSLEQRIKIKISNMRPLQRDKYVEDLYADLKNLVSQKVPAVPLEDGELPYWSRLTWTIPNKTFEMSVTVGNPNTSIADMMHNRLQYRLDCFFQEDVEMLCKSSSTVTSEEEGIVTMVVRYLPEDKVDQIVAGVGVPKFLQSITSGVGKGNLYPLHQSE